LEKKQKLKLFRLFKQAVFLTKELKQIRTNKSIAVLQWFKGMRSENIPVNGVLIKEKALYFAKELNAEKFQASEGWLEKWKSRYVLYL